MKVALALASALTLALACGDSKPAATPDAPPPASAEPDAPQPPAASASASAAPAPTDSAPPAAASSAPPVQNANGTVTVEQKDECTPVGVDFEKRARPKVKECYAEGKKTTKNPDLQGTVKIKVVVDMKGKIKSTTITEKTLPDSVAQCMLKAVKGTPFPEVDKCWDSTITIPITFPTPK